MSIVLMIPIAAIETGARMRPSTDAKVAALAASISASRDAGIGNEGLRLPIEVRKSPRQGEYILVSGLNRLRAVEALERTEIAAFVLDVDDIRAELMELEENLVRADLTVLDRALFVKRFREMFEAEHGEITQGGDRKSTDFQEENQKGNLPLWSDAIIQRLGMSEDKCKRALRVANGLHPDAISALRSTDWLANSAPDWTDNQKALLELSAVLVEKQAEVVALLRDYPSLTMREAIAKAHGAVPPASGDEEERWMRRHCTIFGADKRLRRKFFAEAAISDFELMREAMEEAGFTVRARGPEA